MASGGDATFKIDIEGNASDVAKDVAASTRRAADAITEYEKEIKNLSGDLRRLKGNSEEVSTAKVTLKKKIDAAKSSVSTLTAQLVKQGTSYKQAAGEAKKYGETASKGRIAAAFEKVFAKLPVTVRTSLTKVSDSIGSVLPEIGEALAGAVATGAALAAAAIVAVGAAAAAAAVGLTAFALHASDAAAQANRNREALYGNAEDAKRLGDQINLLAGKVPQGTAELNEMTRALEKTRLSGKDIVTTMQAVAQVTGAVDASAGAKVQELITRGQNTGRFQLQQFRNADLQGTGIEFDEVAKAYAEGTHKSIEAARKELVMGQATLGAGAEALKKVTEKKFGDLNLKNAFSLKNAPTKFFEQISALASGVDLGPLSKGFQEAFGQLSPDAPLGRGIKAIFDVLGGAFVDIASKAIPQLLEGFTWVVVGGLKVINFFYKMRNDIKDAVGEGAGWEQIGIVIIKSIANGVIKANAFLIESTKRVVKATIASVGDIFSGTPKGAGPVEGFAAGVNQGTARAVAAGPPTAAQMNQPGVSGGDTHNTEVHIHTDAKGATDMQSPDFLSALTRSIRDARQTAGVAP